MPRTDQRSNDSVARVFLLLIAPKTTRQTGSTVFAAGASKSQPMARADWGSDRALTPILREMFFIFRGRARSSRAPGRSLGLRKIRELLWPRHIQANQEIREFLGQHDLGRRLQPVIIQVCFTARSRRSRWCRRQSGVDPTRTSGTMSCVLRYSQINGMDRDSGLLSR